MLQYVPGSVRAACRHSGCPRLQHSGEEIKIFERRTFSSTTNLLPFKCGPAYSRTGAPLGDSSCTVLDEQFSWSAFNKRDGRTSWTRPTCTAQAASLCHPRPAQACHPRCLACVFKM